MSHREHLALRRPCGRVASSRHLGLTSPVEMRRLLDASLTGLRDASWATQLGRLYITEKISASELAAGKRWAALVADYSSACQSPRPPATLNLDRTNGTPADPDSAAGIKEVRRHERATKDYLDGKHALRLAGAAAEHAVDVVCVQDQAPAGMMEVESLRSGLQALAIWWSTSKRKSKHSC